MVPSAAQDACAGVCSAAPASVGCVDSVIGGPLPEEVCIHRRCSLLLRQVAGGLCKLTALKSKSDAEREGLDISDDTLVAEAAMSANLMMSYGGTTPAHALLARELVGVGTGAQEVPLQLG